MLLQVTLLHEALPAVAAAVRLLPSADALVGLEVGAAGKAPATHGAEVRVLPGVCALVHKEERPVVEDLPTVTTGQVRVSPVGSLVHKKVVLVPEALATHSTFIHCLPTVSPALLATKVSLPLEAFPKCRERLGLSSSLSV